MHGLFVLWALTFVPINGRHADAKTAARDATLMQIGAKEDYDLLRRAVEKKVPPTLKNMAIVYGAAKKKEVRFSSGPFVVEAKEQSMRLVYTVSF